MNGKSVGGRLTGNRSSSYDTTNTDTETIRQNGSRGLRQDRRERRLLLRPIADRAAVQHRWRLRNWPSTLVTRREELAALPEGANMGLSCGNPERARRAPAGRSGAGPGQRGADSTCSLPGRKVGATGRAIGVDMTPEMLAKARKNIATYHERTGLDNVEFRLGEIEHLPVADNSGGRRHFQLRHQPFAGQTAGVAGDRARAQTGRTGGRVRPGAAQTVADGSGRKRRGAGGVCGRGGAGFGDRADGREAGLVDIVLSSKSAYIDGMVDWQDPLTKRSSRSCPGDEPGDYVTSLEITARKVSTEHIRGAHLPAAEATIPRGDYIAAERVDGECQPAGGNTGSAVVRVRLSLNGQIL